MFGIGPTQLLIILLVVVLIFGTKKLRNLGGDLGGAIKGFKKAMNEDDKDKSLEDQSDSTTTAEKTVEEENKKS